MQPPPASRRRQAGLALAAAALVAGGLFAYRLAGRPRAADAPAGDDPRLTFATPFRNVRPEVKYVGDEACAGCHADVAATFRQHPMGRSLEPVSQLAARERLDAAGNPFEADGCRFSVRREGNRVFHQEAGLDERGREVYRLETEVHYAVGSGAHGRSYLTSRDGFLFQTMVSWFTGPGAWAASPGMRREQGRERAVGAECLACHCNHADAVDDTVNRFREPIFQGHAIGCERCHGPGELHARARADGAAAGPFDDTIVNPKHLEPALREGVCQQCHLKAERRVVRRGRDIYDFRPGLPLHRFWSVFTRLPELADYQKAVGQVEQMYQSRCFAASAGQMGCISCHDPHALPAAGQRVAYYRGRCLQCHGEEDCRLSAADRHAKAPGDNCITCHMPKTQTTDIAHTAATDHRIPRRAEDAARAAPPPRPLRPNESPLVLFHSDLVDPNDPEVDRDLGIALAGIAAGTEPAAAVVLSRMALPRLDAAVRSHPDDVAAWEEKGRTLYYLGRVQEGLACLEEVLARAPERETSLSLAASFAEALGQDDAALGYWRRAVAANPWSATYRYQLAKQLEARRDWGGAAAECQTMLRADPRHHDARLLLIQCLTQRGDPKRARAEFDMLMKLGPAEPERLRRWFAELVQDAATGRGKQP